MSEINVTRIKAAKLQRFDRVKWYYGVTYEIHEVTIDGDMVRCRYKCNRRIQPDELVFGVTSDVSVYMDQDEADERNR